MKFLFFILFWMLGMRYVPVYAQGGGKSGADEAAGRAVKGVASFYSRDLQGSETSTGERLDQSKLTAASYYFKLNTWVRITNLSNNKSIIVRINDRMHKKMADRGRVVDVTRTGAKLLGFLYRGLARVMVEEVPAGTKQ